MVGWWLARLLILMRLGEMAASRPRCLHDVGFQGRLLDGSLRIASTGESISI